MTYAESADSCNMNPHPSQKSVYYLTPSIKSKNYLVDQKLNVGLWPKAIQPQPKAKARF